MFRRLSLKLRALLVEQVCRGATARGLSLAVAVAVVCGAFPLMGFATVMCLLIGSIFKLNHPTLQIVNYAMAPVQLVMMPILFRAGQILVGAKPIPFHPVTMLNVFMADPTAFFVIYGKAGALAVLAWSLILPIIGLIVFWTVYPAMKRLSQRVARSRAVLDPLRN